MQKDFLFFTFSLNSTKWAIRCWALANYYTVDILERIIENLTSDEVRRFKILSNRFKADEEKKLLVLFDAIRGGDFKEVEERCCHPVLWQYGCQGQEQLLSPYATSCFSNLEKSLLFYHFNYKNNIEAHSNLQLAILCRERVLVQGKLLLSPKS